MPCGRRSDGEKHGATEPIAPGNRLRAAIFDALGDIDPVMAEPSPVQTAVPALGISMLSGPRLCLWLIIGEAAFLGLLSGLGGVAPVFPSGTLAPGNHCSFATGNMEPLQTAP